MMPRRVFAVVLCLLVSIGARADDSRPLTVIIAAQGDGVFGTTWKLPVNVEPRHLPNLVAPTGCEVARDRRSWSDALGYWAEEEWYCPNGLADSWIAIDYPFANPNLATIARVRSGDDAERTLFAPAQESRLLIPPDERSGNILVDFLVLGFEHIWKGLDHLLFVGGLIFIARTRRAVILTITGFTIAHSITLALSALDMVRVPVAAVESAIALSIVFLAVEIVKGPRDTLTWRRPVFVSGSFGLLHGFGFAAVLREVGLPQAGLLTGLFAFNVGIELGQVMFASVLMLLLAAVRRVPVGGPTASFAPRFAGYAIGVTSSFWLITRVLVA